MVEKGEWASRLAGTELGQLVVSGHFPDKSKVWVVEQGDTLKGCWSLMPQYRAEGVQILDTEHRAVVARHLLRGLANVGAALDIPHVWTGAVSEDVDAIILKLGGILAPGREYMLPIPRGY